MSERLIECAEFLEELANRIDGWADSSVNGGWSTHQVSANRKAADDCRREAARARLAEAKERGLRTGIGEGPPLPRRAGQR